MLHPARSLRKSRLSALAVGLLILVAYVLRFTGHLFIRTAIHVGLHISWGISVSWRVIHRQQRRMFLAIMGLSVFWITVRAVKFALRTGTIARYLWYLYYIPMLFIPLLMALIAAQLGRPENYRLPRWTRALFVVAGAIVLLVLTNDLHRLVFVFPAGKPLSDEDYRYGLGYLLPAFWHFGCFAAAFALIFFRSRVPGKGRRILTPLFFAGLLALYYLFYLLEYRWLRTAFGDMTVIECLLVVCILESCLRVGLLQSNVGYDELFRSGGSSAVIVDEAYHERIASDLYRPLPEPVLRQAARGPVMLENGLRLSFAPISGRGGVLWVEDISELLRLTDELAETGEYLTEQVNLLQKEVEARHREDALVARNLLYDRVMEGMQEPLRLLAGLTDQLETCTDPAETALLSIRQAIVCTQIKRSANLIFIEERGERIEAAELSFAIREWLSSLRAAGVACAFVFDLEQPLTLAELLPLYAALTRVLLAAAEGLQSVEIVARERNGGPWLRMEICCKPALSALAGPGVTVRREADGLWIVTVALPREGVGA